MKPTYEEYQPKSILNVHKHVDGWLFDKYSAHPYVGCAFGCEFCYSRDQRYLAGRDPEAFSRVIRVKTNAPELLRKELARRPVDVICCGDWQVPAERDHLLSRRMLEVVLDLGFPLMVLERSPLVTRDLDLLAEINHRVWACVIFSISTLDAAVKRAFEPRSPAVAARLRAMEGIAAAGILTGVALMPVLPAVADDETHLGEAVAACAHHGAKFVLAGGLTMSGHQAGRVMGVVQRAFPEALPTYRAFYGTGSYGPPAAYSAALGLRVRDRCRRHGLADRMPRWLGNGPKAANRRVAEGLFARAYDLELENADRRRIWAHRQAAWAIDELNTGIDLVYQGMGRKGLEGIPHVGPRLAVLVESLLGQSTPQEVKGDFAQP